MQPTCESDSNADLIDDSIALWRESSSNFPSLGRQYTEAEQLDRETLFDGYFDTIQAESFQLPQTSSERDAGCRRITSALARVATCAIDMDDPSVESLLRDGFSTLSSDFARSARSFDSRISITDILQACRNAWTACGLQLLLGQTLRLTPAIFAYSMLYPYSDNYLDEAGISREAKIRFSRRFRMRLAGDPLSPENALETPVWHCVQMIESQYARSEYPHVYDCLLAIHHAQEQSISQLHQASSSDIDFLKLTFYKGGTSVLADAYLAAGFLTALQARFAFEWGVVLQLGDDLQDLHQDRQNGSLTLFTRAAGREPLDALTNQTFHFAENVMLRMDGLPQADHVWKELLKRSSRSLLIRSAANAAEFYTKEYLAQLETYSPVRFSFLKSRERLLSRRYAWYATLFEALITEEEADEVLEHSHVTMF